VKMLFCPLTRLVSTFVLYFIFYGFVFDYTIFFCIILVLPLLNPFFFFCVYFFPDISSCAISFSKCKKCIAKCGNVVNIPKSFCK